MRHELILDSVQMWFGNRTILTDVYLQCYTGQIVGLFGRNGSGKTTLLNILCGIIDPDQKYLKIDGLVISTHSKIIKSIRLLPQHHYIPATMTTRKAIDLSLDQAVVVELYSDPLLAPVLSTKIRDLSGGERRYLELMLVLKQTVPFVVLDEPFNGLSPLMKESVAAQIRFHSQQKGIIITDHDYENVYPLVNSAYLLKDGALRSINSITELKEHGYL